MSVSSIVLIFRTWKVCFFSSWFIWAIHSVGLLMVSFPTNQWSIFLVFWIKCMCYISFYSDTNDMVHYFPLLGILVFSKWLLFLLISLCWRVILGLLSMSVILSSSFRFLLLYQFSFILLEFEFEFWFGIEDSMIKSIVSSFDWCTFDCSTYLIPN